jgi:Flp pilus assembly protein TadD
MTVEEEEISNRQGAKAPRKRRISVLAAWRLGGSILLLSLCSLAPHAGAAPQAPSKQTQLAAAALLAEASSAISELRLSDAERALAKLDQKLPEVEFELARLAFYRGQYAQAVSLAERAMLRAPAGTRRPMQAMHELMASTREVTRDFEREVSPDGRYDVIYPPGKDGVLAGYALSVLEAADAALQRILGVQLEAPIRLEIYSSPETLAKVSALTEEQIRTTGTVALSKWNRLMITSPKALVRGYPWADTICHELVHMVLSRKTGDRAPVWLQEGSAKLLERSWRDQDAGLHMDAGTRSLLAEAHKNGKLLTFEQMHPSIAMLPSEDDAALAFAQVSTFMQRFVQDHGEATLRDALARVGKGTDAREALAAAAKQPFAKLESDWKASLPAADPGDDAHRLAPRFRKGDGPTDESAEVVEDDARRFLRIGDLLWDRGRTLAAAREYEKAYKSDTSDPIVAARWARAALQQGDAHAVVAALGPQVERHPGHAPSHALLGRAQLQLGERTAAQRALHESIWINPFDPDPHCDLARASDTPSEREPCEALK